MLPIPPRTVAQVWSSFQLAHRSFLDDGAAGNLLDGRSSTIFFFRVGWNGNRELMREPLLERRQALRLHVSGFIGKGSEWLPSACETRYSCVTVTVTVTVSGPVYLILVPCRTTYEIYEIYANVFSTQHLVDPDEAFWELSLLRGAKVHPHSALSVPLQRISPPLTGGGPLSSAHPAHAPALQLHFCDTILIYHSTQGRRRRKSSACALAVSGRFLERNHTQSAKPQKCHPTQVRSSPHHITSSPNRCVKVHHNF